ncbi:MAG: M15 family metallopeptidase [Gordonia sp. (in: high G+C Gram-positive bacteria)]|uniref:M15 family metallopeptidase n=1 Tax=Gordonia sp. (in: high G+C Gram-positive bacteria) TaxID=84139 RepID=UPI0039E71FE1
MNLRRNLAVVAVAAAAATGTLVAAAPAHADKGRANLLGIPLAPGTAGLTPQLATAYTLAANDAHAQGVPLSINSGKRSVAEQQQLWREGLATYGSPQETRRWVLPPRDSTHVSGEAIDVKPARGAAWLQRNGNRYGLCRPFDNEWWHFELLTFPGGACPKRIPDASYRPRR